MIGIGHNGMRARGTFLNFDRATPTVEPHRACALSAEAFMTPRSYRQGTTSNVKMSLTQLY